MFREILQPSSLRLVLLGSIFVAAAPVIHAQAFYLHDGDRVTFYGDSITAQRFYTQDIESFVDTRYPKLNIAFHNAGVPGDRVTGGYAGDAATRVTRDVAPFHPSVITVMLGMNEGGYTSFNPDVIPPFETGYKKLLTLLREAAPDARITLLENTSYDEVTHGTEFTGYMDTTKRIANSIPAIGASEKVPVINVEAPVEDLIESAAKAQPVLAQLFIPDHIHPAEAAHWVIAAAVMKAWHVTPIVSTVKLNAAQSRVDASERTHVSGLSASGTTLNWDQQDEALPLPLNLNDPLMRLLLSLTDLSSLDQETLSVADLPAGKYTVKVDHEKALGPFTAEELAHGINLATMNTPMLHQAKELSGDLDSRSKLEEAEFSLRVDTSASGKQAASDALAEGEQGLTTKGRDSLKIPVHHYSLELASGSK
ncbi:GDSL-type esterase/lipase family protein [Edaphobacter paludis]|uniref:GDSL-type esterase/lipase family protein n=1 Tax=Edaphobacter paludis TaxID=3035702 RepID=A0AAU7DBM1_9BACT